MNPNKTYQKTPLELYNIIDLFHNNKLDYILFKCEHIFAGTNKNLDILFKTNEDYNLAAKLLKKEEFICYLPESIEKYKQMYVKVINKVLYAIHLHREIAWHGIKALDKKIVFKRKKHLNKLITTPSKEDYLLIHSAHVLFENFKIGHQKKYLKSRVHDKIDWRYINQTIKKRKWKKEFSHLMERLKLNQEPNKLIIFQGLLKQALIQPTNWFALLKKMIKTGSRKLNFRRKGCLITLIGINGTGKTTLTRKTLDQYNPISKFFNGQFGYYFGWDPFLPTTKWVSKTLKKRNETKNKTENGRENKPKNETKKAPVILNHNKQPRFSLFKEIILFYTFLEYLARYYFIIYPQLRQKKLVITDRYFYDVYSQNNYANTSKLINILLKIYPRPDYLFTLNAKIETVQKRDKNVKIFSKVKKNQQRIVHDKENLNLEKERYYYLNNLLKGKILNTEDEIENNINEIIKRTWIKVVK